MVFQHFQHFQRVYVSEIANIRTLNPAENAENNYFFHTEFQQLANSQVLSVNDIEQGALAVQL